MALYEDDMFDDLAYDEAEGAADAFGGGFDEYDDFDDEFDDDDAFDDEFDDMDEMAQFDSDDGFDAYDEFDDEFDDYDEFDSYEEDYDSFDSMLAYSLAAEDADEFFGKLFKGISSIARKVGKGIKKAAPVVGKIARVAAPILSKIPHPYAQMGAQAAKLLGRLRMEGATEEEALEAFAELAVRNPRVMPIVATIGARTMLKGTGKRMSLAKRKKAVRDIKTATKTLVRAGGPTAMRGVPKLVRSAKKMAARKGMPKTMSTAVVKAAARKVAASPSLTRKLARPSPKAVATVRKSGAAKAGARTFTIPGPARITITAA